MRFRIHLKTVTTVIGVVVLWLTAVARADAAPGPQRVREGSLCDAQQTSALKKLLRRPKSYGGPLATHQRASRLGLAFDLTAHVRRAKRTSTGQEAAAIQNDAPAARVDSNDGPLSVLRPIGFLIGPVDSHPRTRAFSPRSPRGPPASV